MAIVIKPITVEVSKPNVFQAIAAKQNDSNSRFLKVTFVNEGEKIYVPPSARVTINAERTDGKSNSFFGEVNNDGTVTVPIHSWILELPGYVNCDVSIIEADSKLTSTTFTLLVEEASHGDGAVSEDPQSDALGELIKEVEALENGMNNVFASAIPNTARGSIVSLTDISPLEHILRVKARSNNLIDFSRPVTETKVAYGYLNEDGKTVTSKFTDDYYSSVTLYYLNDFLLKNKGKTITFSVKESYSDVSLAIVIWGDMTTGKTYQSDNSSDGATSLSLTISEDFTYINRIELRFNRAGSPFTTERTFSEFQLELNPTKTPYAPYVDVSTAKVYRCGKNLCKNLVANSNVNIANGVVTQITADSSAGWIKCTGTYNGTHIGVLGTGTLAVGVQKITFTKDKTFNQVNFGVGGTQRDTMVRVDVSHLPNGIYTISGNFTNIVQGSIAWKEMQIEAGALTEYEPYKQPTIYLVNADGTVEGVTSIYPTTTITSDTEGVVFDVEYNVDTKKYIDNKFTEVNNKIAELAAAIVNS